MPDRDEIVEELRARLLGSLLNQEPLPGTAQPVRFPDFQYIQDAPRLLIADDNLSESFAAPDVGKPIELMNEAEVKDLAQAEGDRFYVYFQPASWSNGQVRISLEVRMAPSQADVLPLGLGGVSAVFEERDGEWVVVEGPITMAI